MVDNKPVRIRLDEASWVKLTETDPSLNSEVLGSVGFGLPADLRVELVAALAPFVACDGVVPRSSSELWVPIRDLGSYRPAALIRFLNFNPQCQPAIDEAELGEFKLLPDPADAGRSLLALE